VQTHGVCSGSWSGCRCTLGLLATCAWQHPLWMKLRDFFVVWMWTIFKVQSLSWEAYIYSPVQGGTYLKPATPASTNLFKKSMICSLTWGEVWLRSCNPLSSQTLTCNVTELYLFRKNSSSQTEVCLCWIKKLDMYTTNNLICMENSVILFFI
jgi:hypothetical protein